MAPVFIIGLRATSFETMAPNPLLRSRSTAQKTFGAATGVSDPRLQKTPIRNNGAGGHAATVAGYGGPGFHHWPEGHILRDIGSESASSQPVHCQKDVRRRYRGQRPAATGAALPTVRRQLEDTHDCMKVLKVGVCDDQVRVCRSLDAILT